MRHFADDGPFHADPFRPLSDSGPDQEPGASRPAREAARLGDDRLLEIEVEPRMEG